jgi:hypothetical protein
LGDKEAKEVNGIKVSHNRVSAKKDTCARQKLRLRPLQRTVLEWEMTEEEIQQAIDKLKHWAGDEYGGQAALARNLGVPRQRLNDWLTGKRTPTLGAWLKIQTFLKTQKRRRK